ncbi:MAG: PIN domain-containing protein [Campylobacterota bacterium]|nr:PIN domain-containing protein [Campylobacterota bacterium]
MTKIFLDANILIDIAYETRPFSIQSGELFSYLVQNLDKYKLFTSCDLMTTVYYVLVKQVGKKEVLERLKFINKIIKAIEFSNAEIDEAIYLMEKNDNFSDLEDTIQFIMAKKVRCDYIITNDSGFYSHDIPLLGSEQALKVIPDKNQ